MTGRVIVITGASAGIGKATAVAAAEAGMRIVVSARRRERLEELAQRCEQIQGCEALAVEADVANPDDVQRLVDQAVERFGRIDVMLANAGMGYFSPLTEMEEAVERRMWEVNYHGSIDCLRAAAAAMRRQEPQPGWGRGHLRLTSSIVARVGLPYYAVYAATKAAQHAAAASLRLELEPEQIDVSCIYPGGTATEFFDVVAAEAGADALAANTPKMFVQTSEQVARHIIRGVRRRKSEVWPSWLIWLGMVLWTICPWLYNVSFRVHAKNCRKALAKTHKGALSTSESEKPAAR